MDQTLANKFQEYSSALQTLNKSLEQEKSELVRDSAVKRFEYTFELCWKTAKVFLDQKHGVQVFSPKETFRSLRKQGLMSDEQTELVLAMTDDRNEIIHTYNMAFADELYQKIGDNYADLLKSVFEDLSKTE